MGKVLINEAASKGGAVLNLVAGKLTFAKEGNSQTANVLNVGIGLDVYNGETKKYDKAYLNVALWDNENTPLATRAQKAKLEAGSFVSFLTGEIKEDEPKEDGTRRFRTNAYDFQYRRFWTLVKDEKEAFAVVGTVRKVYERDGIFEVSIPIEDRDKNTTWYDVVFKDKKAETAKSLLQAGTPCAIRVGEPETNEKGYKKYPAVALAV